MTSAADSSGDATVLDFDVDPGYEGRRVDVVLGELSGLSRSQVSNLLKSGRAGIAGVGPVSPSYRLKGGECLYAHVGAAGQSVEAAAVDFGVVYEDDEMAVVSKPSGIAVHPGAGDRGPTLVSGLVARWPKIEKVGQPGRPGIVHRLDADVSGLMVVALEASAYEQLIAAFSARRIERRYLALVTGRLEADTGRIEGPIGRDPSDSTRRAVVLGGKPATTVFERLAIWDGWTLAEVSLETGRTHQIRVHMEAIGHPVAGDPIYGRRRRIRGGSGATASLLRLDRPFLHAWKLELCHPSRGDRLELEAELPGELRVVLEELGPPVEGSPEGVVDDRSR